MEDKTEFAILSGWSKNLRRRYINTFSAFLIFERFLELVAPNRVGLKKANRNSKTINSYNYFFSSTKESLRVYFLIELSKFFEKRYAMRTLTVSTVLQYAENNLNKLTINDFLEYHKGRVILPELFKNYKALAKKDLDKVKSRLKYNKEIIKKLNDYRDKYLAHDDIKKIEIKITGKDVKVLLRIVKDTIELLYHRLDFASNSYRNFEKESKLEFDRIVKIIQKDEDDRIQKIKTRWGVS